jgi:hypothetical protein
MLQRAAEVNSCFTLLRPPAAEVHGLSLLLPLAADVYSWLAPAAAAYH